MKWSSRVEPFCARRVRRYLRECDVIRYQLSETDKMEFAMPQGSDLAIAEGVDPAAKVISDGETGGTVGREGRRPSRARRRRRPCFGSSLRPRAPFKRPRRKSICDDRRVTQLRSVS